MVNLTMNVWHTLTRWVPWTEGSRRDEAGTLSGQTTSAHDVLRRTTTRRWQHDTAQDGDESCLAKVNRPMTITSCMSFHFHLPSCLPSPLLLSASLLTSLTDLFPHSLSSLNPPRVSIEPPSVRPPNAHVLIRYTLKLNSIFKGMNSEEHCRRRIHQTSWMCFSVLVSCISKPAKFTPFCITMHSRPTETLKTDGKGKGKFVL